MKSFTQLASVIFLGLAISSNLYAEQITDDFTTDAVRDRIKPVGEVRVDTAGQPTVAAPVQTLSVAESTYKTYCSTCHASGVAGSPKLGDKKAWAKRVAQGMETLVKHAIHGIRAMPAKGTCMSCSDDDIKKTVEYMVKKSK